jgi:hypothetical protein
MGPEPRNAPPLPDMKRNLVPSEHVVVTLRVQEYHWLQALEGEIDSADAPILHAAIDAKGESATGSRPATCGQCFSVSARILASASRCGGAWTMGCCTGASTSSPAFVQRDFGWTNCPESAGISLLCAD